MSATDETPVAREVGSVWLDDLGDVWVSTRYRESSAIVNDPPRYFETMAFSRSTYPAAVAEGRSGLLWQSAAYSEREARRQHDLAVRWFSR